MEYGKKTAKALTGAFTKLKDLVKSDSVAPGETHVDENHFKNIPVTLFYSKTYENEGMRLRTGLTDRGDLVEYNFTSAQTMYEQLRHKTMTAQEFQTAYPDAQSVAVVQEVRDVYDVNAQPCNQEKWAGWGYVYHELKSENNLRNEL